ncbi:glucokinase, variant 2 [Fusarium falciforme]|uniref:glucokinase n=2 Tax=Fusarium falciforme TaxID=195108 RepID=A0A9W8RDC5_9HYPO|nr:glucokinase, variant 2 [Fusarium falciforme]
MGAQHGHGHGRERQGAETRKRVWPGLFLRGVAIIVVLVLSQLVLGDGDAKLQLQFPQRYQLQQLRLPLRQDLLSTSASFSISSLLLLLSPSSLHHLLLPRLYPSSSPPAPAASESVCHIPSPFSTAPPTSRPVAMALADESNRVVQEFDFTNDDLNRHVKEFLRQMNEGLSKEGTSLQQIPTYVTGVPNGTEKGLYLAVDLGGTNFRVCSIMLNGDTTFNLTFNKVAIPKELMVAKTASELFSFLAKQIEVFLKEHHAEHFNSHLRRRNTYSTASGYRDEHIFRLGFTFSFPVKQLAINKGLLIRWTKGFDIRDAVGKDVCALLQTEIDKLQLPVKVAALVNDTVGTLMARSYTSTGKSRSILGAIFGTGTNGAYMEKLDNIKKPITGDYDQSTGEMVVNTEWGSFDNQLNVLPSTAWDKALDAESVNPGDQMFEKRVSGMFLGEIVRLAVADMINSEKSSLFKDLNSSSNDWGSTTNIAPQSGFLKPWGLDSSIMSVAAADNTPELSTLRQELENLLHVYTPSLEDAQAFKSVSNAVGRRAARLSAVAIGAIALQSGKLEDPNEEVIDIGVDGSLVEHYPFFRDMIYEALRAIDGIGPRGAEKIRIGIAKDGSGVGAALIALVAAGREKPEDYLVDIKAESSRGRKLSNAIADEPLISTTALVVGGIVGALALAAFWWTKRR